MAETVDIDIYVDLMSHRGESKELLSMETAGYLKMQSAKAITFRTFGQDYLANFTISLIDMLY